MSARRSAKARARWDSLALAGPGVLWLLLFVAVPGATLASYAFLTPGFFTASLPLTLENFRSALSNDLTQTLALNSVVVGAASAIVCLLIAVPTAYWLRYHAGRWAGPILFAITISMFASYLVRIYAWRTILGQRGVLNSLLTGSGIIDEPLSLAFNRFTIVVAMVHIALPFVVIMMHGAFRPLDARYLEAARDLGAGPWRTWRRIVLPVLAAPAFTSGVYVFVLTSADYVTAQFLGGPSDSMIGVQVSVLFSASGDYAGGAALSLLMLVLYAAVFVVGTAILRACRLTGLRWTT